VTALFSTVIGLFQGIGEGTTNLAIFLCCGLLPCIAIRMDAAIGDLNINTVEFAVSREQIVRHKGMFALAGV